MPMYRERTLLDELTFSLNQFNRFFITFSTLLPHIYEHCSSINAIQYLIFWN